jgi:hypothetical protein
VGISRTSLHRGVLTKFAVKGFFSYESLHARNQEKLIPMSYLRGIISYVPQPRIPFFGSRVAVHKQPILFEVLVPAFFILRGSHVQRQYRKQTTLRSKSSTLKELLNEPEPHNHKKGTLSYQPQLSRVSSPALLCCWGRSCSKI